MATKAVSMHQVALPEDIYQAITSEAQYRRVTTRELFASICRDFLDGESWLFSDSDDDEDED